MIKEELNRHLKAALSLENEGVYMYNKLTKDTNNHHAKLFFEKMVTEELKHADFIKRLQKQLESNDTITEENISELETIKPKVINDLKDKEKVKADYINAINSVVEFEKRAEKFYRELETKTKGNAQRIFQILANFEKSHVTILTTELDYATNNPYL